MPILVLSFTVKDGERAEYEESKSDTKEEEEEEGEIKRGKATIAKSERADKKNKEVYVIK